MQKLPPWQGSPERSFQISRITSWMFSSPLTTDKNTSFLVLGLAVKLLAWALPVRLSRRGMDSTAARRLSQC